MFDKTLFNILCLVGLVFLGFVILVVWGTRRKKRILDENALRLAELRMIGEGRRSVEEEAEIIKLESWFRRYENQTRPQNPADVDNR